MSFCFPQWSPIYVKSLTASILLTSIMILPLLCNSFQCFTLSMCWPCLYNCIVHSQKTRNEEFYIWMYSCAYIYMHKRKHIHLSLSIDLHRIMEKNKWQSWENLLKSKSALQILWITNAWGVWETAGKCSLHVYWLVLIKKNGTRSQVVVVIGIQSKTLSKHTSKM